MRTDSLFYRIFQTAPGLLFELMERSPTEATGYEAQARQLIARAQQEEVTGMTREEFVELVETIIVYKLSYLSREEIETMLGLGELKQTRVYQEALEEGREEGREEGVLEAIAEILETRFGERARELTQELTRNTEMTVLKEYLRQAIAVSSLEEFEQILRETQK